MGTDPARWDDARRYRQPYQGYNEVLDRYSEWLLEQRANGWDVVDAHGPISRHLAERRKQDPGYRLAGDGVHIDTTGHWLIARELLVFAWESGVQPQEARKIEARHFVAERRPRPVGRASRLRP